MTLVSGPGNVAFSRRFKLLQANSTLFNHLCLVTLDHVSGHHHYPKEAPNPLSPTRKSGIWDGGKCITADCDKAYSVDLLTARAKKWMVDTHREDPRRPFFLALTHVAPHSQLQIPAGPYPEGRGVKGGVQWLGQPHKLVKHGAGHDQLLHLPALCGKKVARGIQKVRHHDRQAERLF